MWGPNVSFASPGFLYGLLVIPLLVGWYIRRHKEDTSDIRYSTLLPFRSLKPGLRERLRHLPFALRLLQRIVLRLKIV